ncbi:transport protein SEC61 subunit alpha [Penicillium digitatum]|uniref:Uncharacterized protein n=3 Tax=Penicillium digitatum TaxID=36651 RepID=K9GN14_PEND2|nr:hypothetical protein PDIP_52170 [Penicillium digitatum Pd1]EKV12542.1 hypothetical protein PDIP_52170 [Penicillium digitatum Pd1]EKV14546.1 hypothetical protein PDIG_32600 [Penicillium digitatum PHI26]KAG0155979.1 hypothetical protein PDIDSM_3153 [Penicillium digitatum]QQK43228.1 transport protein SEC61 subunit alpha [Penicillium digitatum]
MSPGLSHAPVTLHSDGTQSHETVALTPPRSSVHSTSRNLFKNPPSHRRANTEYITRPQLFEQGIDDTVSGSKNTPWMETFPKKKLEARARVLSDWFQGKSGQAELGLKMGPNGASNGIGLDSRPAPTSMSHKRQSSTPATRFSFFGLRRQPNRPNFPEPADDELLNLDITAALSIPESDDTNDEALDALRDHADKLLRRMQEAYKQRTFAMHQALADKNENQEELQETRSRVDHLRMQLDGMAAKVLDQEKAMQAMAEKLEQERQMRKTEESRSRSDTMRMVHPDDDMPSTALQTPRRGGKRASHSTFTSDSGFESGDESVADSIFSQREGVESPTSTLTAPSPNMSQIALSTPAGPLPTAAIQKNLATVTSTRSSAYDRVLKGLASTRLGSSFSGGNSNASNCNICYGVPASEAWSVMGILQDENRGLKTRLGELEVVIDDCLGLVGP